ncbi:hypothetical protein DCC81_14540 [Chitinophaga parva]|uniref:ABC-three component systems C-terminal domain-containing protein n=1 Tax=Chitinophaga parva TaxID=2169414 RepID=A0A2T7BGU0_9BACT|nr:ABC-three component system protein [Chitinophaga parva]PUZ25499.1 hypothetical protein DCC81_14540 [Chitinophaga parva]
MEIPSHGAVAPALGYYYQAIYALKLLLESEEPDAYVSIETLDDVYFSDGSKKELHQLKHTVAEDAKITIKSDNLWRTLKVWCDYLSKNDPGGGYFVLSTVAEIGAKDTLQELLTFGSNREQFEKDLLEEAERVIEARKTTDLENVEKKLQEAKDKPLPYDKKYKGCLAFKSLTPSKRKLLLQRIRLNPGQFSMTEANEMVSSYIRKTTQPQNIGPLSEFILAWWDREAVRSLTNERQENIFLSELQEFISRKNAELFDDGFTDDALQISLPPITNPHPVHAKQLEIIDASDVQKKRSFTTEMKARIQREIWINKSLPSAKKLKNYDERLVEEWSYKFEETTVKKDSLSDDEIKEYGRKLLDWTHNEAHQQVASISHQYNNPDLVRGSYQMLSTKRSVGWHCNFLTLIPDATENE